ncbi:hypothetical protein A9976_22575 [Delftia sp. UME58]|nr:hypothetical protein [Delftia sp. UME58]
MPWGTVLGAGLHCAVAVAAPAQGLVMTSYQTQYHALYASTVTEYTFSEGGVVQQGSSPPATADWITPSNYWDGGWASNSWNEHYTYSYQGQVVQTTDPMGIPAAAAWATISSFQIEGYSFTRPIGSTVFHYSLDGIQTLLAMDASSIPANAAWAGLSSMSDGWQPTQNHGFASYVLGRPVFSLAPAVDPQAGGVTAKARVALDRDGTGYWQVLAAAAAAPDAAALQAGGASVGLTAGVVHDIDIGGLAVNTAYRLHFIARDGAGRVQPDVASVPFTTLRREQTIDFAQPSAQTFGTTFTPVATATSGLAVTFSASAPEVCTVDAAGVFSFHSAGTCRMTARQVGDATYGPAPEMAYPVTVQPAAQTIVWSMPAALVVDARVALSAAGGGSAQAVQFSSLTPAACSVSGAEVYGRQAGTDNCLLAADQQGDANHLPAARQVLSLSIGKGSQAIAFTSVAPAGAKVGDTYAVAATGGASGKAVVFSVDAATAAHCTIAGSSVSFTTTGPCRILADQAGDANYEAAARQQQSVQIALAAATLVITSTPNPSKPGDDVTINVSAVTEVQAHREALRAMAALLPRGDITVSYNGSLLGSAPLASGAASITVRVPLEPGSHNLVVDYSGDASHAPMSQGFTQAVAAAPVPTPVPTPVPALHTVALFMLGLLAALVGAGRLRRAR